MLKSTTSGFSENTIPRKKNCTFFSKAGKVRLARIWEDQHLSEEMVISSWISAGLSDSVLKENVSEYMQHFLQARYLRFGSSNVLSDKYNPYFQLANSGLARNVQWEGDLSYSARANKEFKKRTQNRVSREYERLRKCILDGKLKPTPDFKNILRHPTYRVNILEMRIKKFKKLYESEPSYFCDAESRTKVKSEVGKTKTDLVVEICNDISTSPTLTFSSKSSTLGTPISQSDSIIPRNINQKMDRLSSSSGFQEGSLSLETLEEENQSSHKNSSFSSSSRKVFKPCRGQGKLFVDANRQLQSRASNNSTTSSIFELFESHCNQSTPWVSPFVNIVFEEEDTTNMYKLADEVLWLFRRKLRASKPLAEKILNQIVESEFEGF